MAEPVSRISAPVAGPLLLYLAAWTLLVSVGALPFPESLFITSMLFFVLPATLLMVAMVRFVWLLLLRARVVERTIPVAFVRNLALTLSTVLIVSMLFSAETTLRRSIGMAAGDLKELMTDDIPTSMRTQFADRFVVVTNQILDGFFAGEELTRVEQDRAEIRIQTFARSVSDGVLNYAEVEKLLEVYGNASTATTETAEPLVMPENSWPDATTTQGD